MAMKQGCVVHFRENGHGGHCRMCGEASRFVEVEGQRLEVCASCFSRKPLVRDQFLIGQGIEPATASVINTS
jgi:hypothetical protein